MPSLAPGGLNAKLFQWVPFRGVVGKLALIAIVTPITTLGPIALGMPSLLPVAFACVFVLDVVIVVAICLFSHFHPLTAMLEGADLVRAQKNEMAANQVTGPVTAITVPGVGDG